MSRGIVLIDTSVVLELLKVPGKSGSMQDAKKEFADRAQHSELILPLATVVETGNHIGQ